MTAARVVQETSPSTRPPQSGRRPVQRGYTLEGPNGAYFEATPASPMIGEIDVAAMVATIPEAFMMRGMFFAPLITNAGDGLADLAPKLTRAPRLGSYLPFGDYPMSDFLRLFDVAARRSHPTRPSREAYRLRARAELEVFLRSRLGQITTHLVSDPSAALLKYPEALQILTKGPLATATAYGARSVKIDFATYHGVIEYPLGVFEAVVMSFGYTPSTVVDVYAPDAVSYLVSWD